MAMGDLGVDPDEVALYHQNAGVSSAAILRFEREEDASAAVRRLNGIRSAALQGVSHHAPVKARFGWTSAAAARARLATAFVPQLATKPIRWWASVRYEAGAWANRLPGLAHGPI